MGMLINHGRSHAIGPIGLVLEQGMPAVLEVVAPGGTEQVELGGQGDSKGTDAITVGRRMKRICLSCRAPRR